MTERAMEVDSGFGTLLREWRSRRRVSQLDLAVEAGVSSRHVSFIETGRAQPSRDMVLMLARARSWNLLKANNGAVRLVETFTDPSAASEWSGNAMRLMFHPRGFRPHIVNWEAMAAALIQWLHRDVLSGIGGAETRRLLEELLSYPGVPPRWRTLDLDVSTAPFLAIDFRKNDLHLRFFSTLTSLGTPHDITLQELRVEAFFPADAETEASDYWTP